MSVKCDVEEGMFPSESLVTIDTGYEKVQALVSDQLLSNGEIELSVDSFEDDDFFVIIPGEVTKGQRIVRFKRPTPEV